MNRSAWIVAGFAAITIACGGDAAKTAQQKGADNKTTAQGNITVAGCLARADEMPGSIGTSGSGSAPAANPPAPGTSTATPPAMTERFVLRQAQPIGPNSAPSAVGTAGSGSPYALEGDVAELRAHAGQRVEVLGRVDASVSDPSGQRLIVTSVRTIADTCANP
jgi:hypothetical protein